MVVWLATGLWAIIFLIAAVISNALGFGDAAETALNIAKGICICTAIFCVVAALIPSFGPPLPQCGQHSSMPTCGHRMSKPQSCSLHVAPVRLSSINYRRQGPHDVSQDHIDGSIFKLGCVRRRRSGRARVGASGSSREY